MDPNTEGAVTTPDPSLDAMTNEGGPTGETLPAAATELQSLSKTEIDNLISDAVDKARASWEHEAGKELRQASESANAGAKLALQNAVLEAVRAGMAFTGGDAKEALAVGARRFTVALEGSSPQMQVTVGTPDCDAAEAIAKAKYLIYFGITDRYAKVDVRPE